MQITFGSVCSGMESASLAWHPLGWRTAFVAEIDPPACALLAERLPDVPNLGDLTKWRDWVTTHPELLASIDVLIGGTPCQGFSFAGLRGSLSDDRSNLALDFLELADAIDTLRRARGKPALVIVWENVPGVYSTEDNAFGCFIGALVGADAPLVPGRGQKWTHAGVVDGPQRTAAWRTLDAQFFGVAQRRARVFVVASAGAICPAEVLLERCGVPGNPAPRRQAREDAAASFEQRSTEHGQGAAAIETDQIANTLGGASQSGGFRTTDLDNQGAFIPIAFGDPIPILDGAKGRGERENSSRDGSALGEQGAPMFTLRANSAHAIAFDTTQLAFGGNNTEGEIDVAAALLNHHPRCDFETETLVAFDATQITNPDNRANPQPGDPVHTLSANQHPPAIAFSSKDYGQDATEDLAPTLRAMGFTDSHANGGGQLAVAFAMRGRDGENMPEVHEDGELASALRAESGGSTRDLVAFADVADPLVTKEGETYTQEGSGNFRVRNVITDIVRWAVRRLTPRECERLQGAPDDWTLVKVKRVSRKNNALIAAIADAGGAVVVLGKGQNQRPYQMIDGEPWQLMADANRYKMCGNSKAVPVVRWLGERIEQAHALAKAREAA